MHPGKAGTSTRPRVPRTTSASATLIATTEHKALVACGYTRPYNDQDVAHEADTFDRCTGPSVDPHRMQERVGSITDVESEPFNPSQNESYTTPTSARSGVDEIG